MTTPVGDQSQLRACCGSGSHTRRMRRYSSDPRYQYKVSSSAPYLANDLMYLDGYGGQRVYIIPSKQLVIVRIGLTRRDWDDSGLPNAVLAGIR
jgi:CubicO group peptidase (beta-lactamase class C family)